MPDRRAGVSAFVAEYLRRLSLLDAILLLASLFSALWLKVFLTAATPADLAWILTPTMHLVSAFTGLPFSFDPAQGYIGMENAIVVGTSCAGVNYLVITLCMTTGSFVPRITRYKLPAFAGLVLAAYAVTLLVNSCRIIGGIALVRAAGIFRFAATGAIHDAEGIFVYFFFLVLYYGLLQALIGGREARARRTA